MVEIYGENPNVDYMLKFDKIIGNKPINPLKSDNKLYGQGNLHEMFVEEEMPDKDFKFIGTDRNIYRFNVDNWNYILREYGRSKSVELITLNNGSIEQLVEMGIATLLLKAENHP